MDAKSRTWWIIAIFALGAVVLVCAGLGLSIRFAPDVYRWARQQSLPKVGAAAPDFSLNSLDGQVVQLSQFRGYPVLLTFAESWCPDCQAEAPVLQSLHQSHPEVVVLMADKEDASLVRKFAADFGMKYPVLLDESGTISRQYQIYAIPTTFFIDSDGMIRYVLIEASTPEALAQRLPLIGVEP